jgi:hypothetical protein
MNQFFIGTVPYIIFEFVIEFPDIFDSINWTAGGSLRNYDPRG